LQIKKRKCCLDNPQSAIANPQSPIRNFTGVAHASIDAPPPMKMGDPLLILGDLSVLGALVVSF